MISSNEERFRQRESVGHCYKCQKRDTFPLSVSVFVSPRVGNSEEIRDRDMCIRTHITCGNVELAIKIRVRLRKRREETDKVKGEGISGAAKRKRVVKINEMLHILSPSCCPYSKHFNSWSTI